MTHLLLRANPTNELGASTMAELTFVLTVLYAVIALCNIALLVLLRLPPPSTWRFNRRRDRWEQR